MFGNLKTLLNNSLIKDITMEIFKYLELNENEKITYQNLWDAVKVVLRGKFIASNVLPKEKKVKIKKLTLRRQTKIKEGERKGGGINMTTEIN